jgi:cbb3-type cytochrome oxidase maturation protein
MTSLAWLVPVALFLGGLGLATFLWALRSNQFEDLDGAGWRALDDEKPLVKPSTDGASSAQRGTH